MTRYDLEGPWTGASLREAKRTLPLKSWAWIAALAFGLTLAVVLKWPN